MNSRQVIECSKKSFIAFKNPYGSVEKVYPLIIEQCEEQDELYYLGVKNRSQISRQFIQSLEQVGFFLHTLDKASIAGRAVDVALKNPYTGRPMTGSSSGTAVNVLLGINDVGIGTDGGGSVLAPAMAVNLFGFISPLLDQSHMQRNESKVSTDGIQFHVSLGLMTKKLGLLKQLLDYCLPEVGEAHSEGLTNNCRISYDSTEFPTMQEELLETEKGIQQDLSFKLEARETVIPRLKEQLKSCDVLISREGPVDFAGLGDTVLGHFDSQTLTYQQQAKKGLLRVVNMLGATALTIPTGDFAVGRLLICESKPEKIAKLLELAERWAAAYPDQFQKYFSECQEYFPAEFGER